MLNFNFVLYCFVLFLSGRANSQFTPLKDACILGSNAATQSNVMSPQECIDLCRNAASFYCQSIEYNSANKMCHMSTMNQKTSIFYREPCTVSGWLYAERTGNYNNNGYEIICGTQGAAGMACDGLFLPGTVTCKCPSGYKCESDPQIPDRFSCKLDNNDDEIICGTPQAAGMACNGLFAPGTVACKCANGYKCESHPQIPDLFSCKSDTNDGEIICGSPQAAGMACNGLFAPGTVACKCAYGYKCESHPQIPDLFSCKSETEQEVEFCKSPTDACGGLLILPGEKFCKCRPGYQCRTYVIPNRPDIRTETATCQKENDDNRSICGPNDACDGLAPPGIVFCRCPQEAVCQTDPMIPDASYCKSRSAN